MFDADHAMSFLTGGFIHRRHDSWEISLGRPWIRIGETLAAGANVDADLRCDIKASGFWCWAFFDVRVFNPFARSYQNNKVSKCISQLASKITDKFDMHRSTIMNYIRTKLSFHLIRSQCCVSGVHAVFVPHKSTSMMLNMFKRSPRSDGKWANTRKQFI